MYSHTMGEIANIDDNKMEVQKAAAHIIQAGFKSAGIKNDDGFVGLKKLLNARKMTVDKFGEEHWEDDNTAIGKGTELMFRLQKLLDSKVAELSEATVTHKFCPENIQDVKNLVASMNKLREEQKNDRTQQGKIIDV